MPKLTKDYMRADGGPNIRGIPWTVIDEKATWRYEETELAVRLTLPNLHCENWSGFLIRDSFLHPSRYRFVLDVVGNQPGSTMGLWSSFEPWPWRTASSVRLSVLAHLF